MDLLFEDSMNISTVYDLAKGNQSLQVPFTITGAGTKIVEWFIDGVAQEYDKNVDEIVDVTSTRTKYIQLSDLARGAHSLDVRAYVKLDETNFYSKVFHREFIIENSGIYDKSPIVVLSYIKDNMDDTTIELEQYIPYDLTFSVYDPVSPQSIPVEIFFNDEVIATLNTKNGTVNKYPIVPVKTGEGIIKISTSGIETSISVDVAKNKMGLQELMSDLELAFTAVGMSNNQVSKYFWQGNGITATLNGFNFTDTSGWVNDRLIM